MVVNKKRAVKVSAKYGILPIPKKLFPALLKIAKADEIAVPNTRCSTSILRTKPWNYGGFLGRSPKPLFFFLGVVGDAFLFIGKKEKHPLQFIS